MTYETFMIAVEPGHPLPQPKAEMFTQSPMTGIYYAIRITSVAGLRWLDNGHIEVTVRGHRREAHYGEIVAARKAVPHE